MNAHRVAVAAVVLALAAWGCGSAGDPGDDVGDLTGDWHYSGVQTAGTQIVYEGTLRVSRQSGATFSGELDVQSTTPQGTVARVRGVANGRAISAEAVDFDLELTDDTRRHVGRIVLDSINGTWVNDDLSSVGSFTLVRLPR
jgi:hypothetical protein